MQSIKMHFYKYMLGQFQERIAHVDAMHVWRSESIQYAMLQKQCKPKRR